MRYAFSLALIFAAANLSAEDRLKVDSMASESSPDRVAMVSMTPPSQEAAKRTVDSLASSCNDRNFVAFMNHFTPKQRSAIQKKMEDIFIRHDPEMHINDVILLSESDVSMAIGVRYDWSSRSRSNATTFASRVVLKKVSGEWKIDSEHVKSSTPKSRPAAAGGQNFNFGGGGNVDLQNWDPYNPPAHLIDPSLECLRGDIGIRPGFGCANGGCANGRCGVR